MGVYFFKNIVDNLKNLVRLIEHEARTRLYFRTFA